MGIKGGSILYECRHCGEVFSDCHSPDWHASIVWPTLGLDLDHDITHHAQSAKLFAIHHCRQGTDQQRGRWGVADLIGAAEDMAHELPKPKEDTP